MPIDKEEVRRVARLAHLELPRVQDANGHWTEPSEHLIDDATLERLAKDMAQVLAYIDQLREVDVEGVEPTSHGVPLPTRLREDVGRDGLSADALLAATPARIGDAVAVPKIVE